MTPDFMMRWLWVVWLISWVAAAAWSDRSIKRPRATRKLIYQLLTVAGIILLFQPYRFSVDSVVWQLGRAVQYGLVVVALLGFLFAWWARIYLGRLWSSAVGRKANHYLVDTGPYALVRHPIYTGVILATLVTAVMRGTVLAVTGAAIMMLGWHTKARLEEQYLRDELGADTYDAYGAARADARTVRVVCGHAKLGRCVEREASILLGLLPTQTAGRRPEALTQARGKDNSDRSRAQREWLQQDVVNQDRRSPSARCGPTRAAFEPPLDDQARPADHCQPA